MESSEDRGVMIDEDVLRCIQQMKNLREDKSVKESVGRGSITPRIPQETLRVKIASAIEKRQKLILIYTQGTYNPPHLGHLNMVLDAREKLESMGVYCVVASMMAPSPDKHIVAKIKSTKKSDGEGDSLTPIEGKVAASEYLHLQHGERCFLVEKMLWNRGLQNEVFVDRWEGLVGKVQVTSAWLTMQIWFEEQVKAYLDVNYASEEAARLFRELEPQATFLVGSDKLNYSRSVDSMNDALSFEGRKFHLPIVIKQRSDQNNEGAEVKMQRIIAYDKDEAIRKKQFVCNSRPNFSSTQFRAKISEMEDETKRKHEAKGDQLIRE